MCDLAPARVRVLAQLAVARQLRQKFLQKPAQLLSPKQSHLPLERTQCQALWDFAPAFVSFRAASTALVPVLALRSPRQLVCKSQLQLISRRINRTFGEELLARQVDCPAPTAGNLVGYPSLLKVVLEHSLLKAF